MKTKKTTNPRNSRKAKKKKHEENCRKHIIIELLQASDNFLFNDKDKILKQPEEIDKLYTEEKPLR